MRRRRNTKHKRRHQSPIVDPASHAGKPAAVYYRKDASGYYGECRIGNCRYGTVCHSRAQVREEMRQHRRRVHPDPAIIPADC